MFSDRLTKALRYKRTGNVCHALEKLFDEGMNPNVPTDIWGHSATFVVFARGNERLDTLMITRGGDINSQNSDGMPIISYYAKKMPRHVWGYVLQLVAYGANPDLADNEGDTPLMYAARYDRIHIAAELIRVGADAGRKNNKGQTAEDIASEENNQEMLDLLTSFKNGVNHPVFKELEESKAWSRYLNVWTQYHPERWPFVVHRIAYPEEYGLDRNVPGYWR